MITRTAVPACESCVRAELDHAEGDERAGECVAVSPRADEWVDVATQIALRGDVEWEKKQVENNYGAHGLAWASQGEQDDSGFIG